MSWAGIVFSLPSGIGEDLEADTAGAHLGEVLARLEHGVHARVRPEHRSRQPSRDDLEAELGMP
jgi:hypothetical protein